MQKVVARMPPHIAFTQHKVSGCIKGRGLVSNAFASVLRLKVSSDFQLWPVPNAAVLVSGLCPELSCLFTNGQRAHEAVAGEVDYMS